MKVQEYRDLEKLSEIVNELPQVVTNFIEQKLDENVSPTTLLEYSRDFCIFFSWITPKLWPYIEQHNELKLELFNEITREHVQEFLDYLQFSKNHKYSTRLRRFHALRSLFSFIHRDFENTGFPILLRNVFATFTMESSNRPLEVARQLQNKVLRVKEIDQFIKFVMEGVSKHNNPRAECSYIQNRARDVSIIALFLESGLIVSDLVNMDINDINLMEGYTFVTRQKAKIRMRHKVIFGEKAKQYLVNYLDVRNKTYNPQNEEEAFFLAKPNGEIHGKRISKRAIQDMVKKYALKFGTTKVTVRQLTHSFGLQFAEKNTARNMKQQMTHRNIESVEKYLILSSIIK
ncbi:tyrosine-type recombinase/integrase [Paenibacillus xylanexedens]|uniref:tyrosine-type recombinase/integrase n=1 Tax=Paenibacillus xylanexedens TaxID=528191 RepID=UPI001F007910|nr:tyrosine-type recombinase/integrase [Paenibacillus xylanexedens]MCF7753962.1 tyrosine-type recombinase/integrase [Paenibacillus xylanexedens]